MCEVVEPFSPALLRLCCLCASHLAALAAVTSALMKMQQQFQDQPSNHHGILIVAGGRDMFANAAITLHILRHTLRSTLPVEIVHFGDQELPQDVLAVIRSYNGTTNIDNRQTAAAADRKQARRHLRQETQPTQLQGHGMVYVTDALQASPQHEVAVQHRYSAGCTACCRHGL